MRICCWKREIPIFFLLSSNVEQFDLPDGMLSGSYH